MLDTRLTMTVKIIVKSPNLHYEDVVLECGSDWNVAQLKTCISENYPSKPKPDEQRLIYSGKLLQNNQVLGEFLRDLGEHATHTIHLVCRASMTTPDEGKQKSNVQMGHEDAEDNGGLRFRGTSQVASSSTYPQLGVNTDPLMQQYLWWQQTYSQQYWAQYAQYMTAANQWASREPAGTPPTAIPQPIAVNPPVVPAPQEQDQGAPGVILAPAEDENAGIRAARDWLDWTYIGTRLAILMSFIYFYSSLFRLLLVMLIAAVIYLYQFTVKQRADRNNPVEVDNNVNNENQEQENNSEAHPAPPQAPDAQPNRNASSFSLALSLITGFFASLIPEVPAPEAAVN